MIMMAYGGDGLGGDGLASLAPVIHESLALVPKSVTRQSTEQAILYKVKY